MIESLAAHQPAPSRHPAASARRTSASTISQRATDAAGHDRQAGVQRFDERQPERLGRGVRLAEHIRRASSAGTSLRSPRKRTRSAMPPRCTIVSSCRRYATSAGRCAPPTIQQVHPATSRSSRQRLEQHVLSLPCLEAADLHDDHVRRRCTRALVRIGARSTSSRIAGSWRPGSRPARSVHRQPSREPRSHVNGCCRSPGRAARRRASRSSQWRPSPAMCTQSTTGIPRAYDRAEHHVGPRLVADHDVERSRRSNDRQRAACPEQRVRPAESNPAQQVRDDGPATRAPR